MSRPRLRRRTSAVSFTGRSSSGDSVPSDVTVKMRPPCPRRTLLTRTGSLASGRTITSPTSTSPAGITSSTNGDDTGQEDQLHLEGERAVSHISTPGDVDPGPGHGHDLGDPPSPVRRGLRMGIPITCGCRRSWCLARSAGFPGVFLAGYALVEAMAQLRRSWARRGLTRMCLGVVLTGSRRGGTWGTGGGRSWSHRAGSELPGRLCERLRRVGQPRSGVAASRWWRIRGGGAA